MLVLIYRSFRRQLPSFVLISILLVSILGITATSLLLPKNVHAVPQTSYSLLGTHPQAAAQSTSDGKMLRNLGVLNGKIYAAYGDLVNNTGPVYINPYSISGGTFTGSELTVPSESITTFKVINNQLYTTTDDPTCALVCPAGYAYGTPWQLKTPIQAAHVFDIATLDGNDLWLVGSSDEVVDGAHAWRSTDGGNTWNVVQTDTNVVVNDAEHYMWILTMNGKIYLQAENVDDAPMRVFDGNSWTTGTTTPIRGMEVFNNKIIGRSSGRIATFDGTTVTELDSLQNNANVADTYVDGSYLYVLRNDGTLTRTDNLTTWQELGFTVDSATSIAVTGNKAYIGTADSKLYGSTSTLPSYTPDDPTYTISPPPQYVSKFGSSGSAAGRFSNPQAIAFDSAGIMYVADSNNNRVQKFNSAGNYIGNLGTAGSGDGQFSNPTGIALDTAGNIYISDAGNTRVQKFNSAGVYQLQWAVGSPGWIAIDASDHVYLIDYAYDSNVILEYDTSGNLIGPFNNIHSGDGSFNVPAGMAFDTSGNIFVVDASNNRIQKFNSSKQFVTKWGYFGNIAGYFSGPSGIAIDKNNNVIVVDYSNNRLQMFDNNGTFKAQWGTSGTGNGQFTNPISVAIYNDNFYVVDNGRNRIQQFAYKTSQTIGNGDTQILIESPYESNITCSSAVAAASLAKQDANTTYPAGLVDYCLQVAPGSTKTMNITFVTTMTPQQVSARKYNSTTQAYSSVPGAVITETTLGGKHALKLTYDITDGGQLDRDGTANGSILDPVGLALTANTTGSLSNSLVNTGQNAGLFMIVSALGIVIVVGLAVKSHPKKPKN